MRETRRIDFTINVKNLAREIILINVLAIELSRSLDFPFRIVAHLNNVILSGVESSPTDFH